VHDELVVELPSVGEVTVMGAPVGNEQLGQVDMNSALPDNVVPRVLTSSGSDVTLRIARGHEAEDAIRDILLLSDRLIRLIPSIVYGGEDE